VYDQIMSPEPFIRKCRSLARAKSISVEVIDGRVRLAWINDDGADFMERADAIGLGITYDMFLETLSEAGWTRDTSGRYPISDTIGHRLKRLLDIK
jgi:hypothetical protein